MKKLVMLVLVACFALSGKVVLAQEGEGGEAPKEAAAADAGHKEEHAAGKHGKHKGDGHAAHKAGGKHKGKKKKEAAAPATEAPTE